MGTASVPVLVKTSFPARALEIGPRGPADDGRPSLSAPCRLTGPGVLCPQRLLASSGPVSPLALRSRRLLLPSRLTCVLFCSTLSGSPGATPHRPSRLIALVSRKESHVSLLCSPRSLSSLHSSGGRPAPRRPRSLKTAVPCRRNDLPTTAGGPWTWTTRGKLAPGSHPADTPSGTLAFAGRERSGRRRGRRRIP